MTTPVYKALASPIRILLACAALSILPNVSAQQYTVGDIVENFTLVDRKSGQPVSLSDFEGKIVFLEWFAYWCPYCIAAAEQVKPGIVDYYNQRNGNPSGIPVLHVGINLQGDAESLTQQFIDRFGLGQVLNDFDASLARRFQNFGQPVFVIINGVENSPSHEQWELVYSRLGYGDLQHPIQTFRNAIDSVKAAPAIQAPLITASPTGQRAATGSTLELSVVASGETLSYQWFRDASPLSGQTAPTLKIEGLTLADAGSYLVKVSNPGGEVSSESAQIEVLLSLDDFLENAGLAVGQRGHAADPDHDGFNNTFEYLAQTNPNDSNDKPTAQFAFVKQDGVPALLIQFSPSSDALNVQLEAQFWSEPASAGSATVPLPLDAPIAIAQPIPENAKTYLARLVATPTAN